MAARSPFGEWLRQRRHLLDLTQAQLARQISCSAITIRKLEAGERKPSLELARALSLTLRIPTRERAAFIQFARADELGASFRLPAWEPEQLSWRSGQLPAQGSVLQSTTVGVTLQYDLVVTHPPQVNPFTDGRTLFKINAVGSVTGDLEGHMEVRLIQVIMPKQPDADYSLALPMQVGAFFEIQTAADSIAGSYVGSMTPMTDAAGSGTARFQATGQVISVTPGLVDLFLNHVFVDDVVRLVEGTGTGASGSMQLKPPG